MTTTNPEVEALSSEPSTLTLASGREVVVERLRTRALMALLKIITAGAGDILFSLRLDEESSAEELTAKLIGTTILAIPEAEDEVIEFVNRMVFPANVPKGRLTPGQAEQAAEDEAALREELLDPDLDDLVAILERIITVEGPHVVALGKRLGTLIQAQQKSESAKRGGSSKRSS